MNENKNYDYSISFTRVCAMFFIIICHIGSYFGRIAVGQFFNVGVPIFFMISGYLYGNRRIKNIGVWLKGRMVRIYIPLLMWGAVYIAQILVTGRPLPPAKEILFFCLNLQGLNAICLKAPYLANGPWFFTVIMICYFSVAIYQIIEKKYDKIQNIFYYGGILFLALFVSLVFLGLKIPISFWVGYGLRKRGMLEKRRVYNIIVVVFTFVVGVCLRLGAKGSLDGTILYDEIIAAISHTLIAASFFLGIRWLFDIFESTMQTVSKSKVIRWLDKISIYVYISHTWYIAAIFGIGFPLAIGLLIYFILVIAGASVLFICGNRLSRCIIG